MFFSVTDILISLDPVHTNSNRISRYRIKWTTWSSSASAFDSMAGPVVGLQLVSCRIFSLCVLLESAPSRSAGCIRSLAAGQLSTTRSIRGQVVVSYGVCLSLSVDHLAPQLFEIMFPGSCVLRGSRRIKRQSQPGKKVASMTAPRIWPPPGNR
jgi:hypothetical protein